jgi:hypothetical protein
MAPTKRRYIWNRAAATAMAAHRLTRQRVRRAGALDQASLSKSTVTSVAIASTD